MIDLKTQARLGLPFALPLAGGGTAREDGRARGLVTSALCVETGGVSPGHLLRLVSADRHGSPQVELTTARKDFGYGIAVSTVTGDHDPVDVCQSGLVRVLAGSTITAGDFLYPDPDTAGSCAGQPALVGGVFGRALEDGVATDLIWAWVEFDVFPVGAHAQLGSTPGIRRHTDLVESCVLTNLEAYEGAGHGPNNPALINDGDDATYHSERNEAHGGIIADLLRPFWASALRVKWLGNYDGIIKLYGSSNGTSWTLVWSVVAGGATYDAVDTFEPAQYRWWKLTAAAGNDNEQFYAWELYEDSGKYIYVTSDADSALIDDLLVNGTRLLPAAGTTGQMLLKDSDDDYDVIWAPGGTTIQVEEVDGVPSVAASEMHFPNGTLTDEGGGVVTYAPTNPGYILESLIDAKGDLIAGTADNTAGRVAVGANGDALIADSAASAGIAWLKNTQAASDPTTNDDSDDDYAIGSRWINTTTDEEFVALDVTVGAAVWTSTTAGGAGGAPTNAQYVTIAANVSLSAEVIRPHLGNYFHETKPDSPNATYDDEFDDTTGMSGTVNGLNARWNWRNQGAATATFTKQGWLTINCPAQASGNNWRILEIAALADGTYEAKISVEGVLAMGTAKGFHGAVVMVDAVNGDFYMVGWGTDSGAVTLQIQKWTNVTTWSSNLVTAAFPTNGNFPPIFVRIVKAGTAMEVWFSFDGIGWQRRHAWTEDVTPTRIGLGVNENAGNTGLIKLHVDYFRKVA